MDPHALAHDLFRRAELEEQTAHRLDSGDDVEAVRQQVRRLARERGIGIRTAVMGDVLVVVRADAAIWAEPAATMREKLTPKND